MRHLSSRRLGQRTWWLALLAAAAVVTLPATSAAKPPGGGSGGGGGTATATSFAGRAYALDADVSLLSQHVHVGPVADTGQLPSTGGFLSAQLLSLHSAAPLLIDAGILTAATAGAGDQAASFASVADLHVNLASLLDVRAGILQAEASGRCVNGTATYSGTSDLASLAIAGAGTNLAIAVAAQPNTQITIPGLATIWINRQYVDGNGRFVVNALEVHVGGVLAGVATADLVVGHAEVALTCGSSGGGNPPPCQVKDFVTGGGQFAVPGGNASFGMVGGLKPNGLSGHFTMVNHATGQKISGDTVTGYVTTGTNARRLTYTNGSGDSIVVDVVDNGEPGTNDSIQVTYNGAPQGGGTLLHGNIQLHHPNGCDTTSTKPRH